MKMVYILLQKLIFKKYLSCIKKTLPKKAGGKKESINIITKQMSIL